MSAAFETAAIGRGPVAAAAPDVSIVVPTYCEAENLGELVARIDAALSRTGLSFEIVVVDDDSPDGSAEICRKLGGVYPVRLIVRKHQRGFSSAVIAGLNAARGGALVVMDADLSHPPEQIPELVERLARHKLAIASRYLRGGGTDQRWPLRRRWLSRMGALLARPLTSVSDPMSGFFALSRESYRRIASDLTPVGYKVALELIVKLPCRDVGEVPIFFDERRRGCSKLGLRENLQYLRHVMRLFAYRLRHWDREPADMQYGVLTTARMDANDRLSEVVTMIPPPPRVRVWRAVAAACALSLLILLTLWAYPALRDLVLRQEGWIVEVAPASIEVAVPAGETSAPLTVKLRNLSPSPVRVEGVRTSCGCFVALEQLPMELGPGESRRVRFRVDQAADDRGVYTQEAQFFLDRPSPPVKLHLKVGRAGAARLVSR
ncbi:MAG: hypothetical protein DCC67_09630 [Planctomycetota bacterium]|nr:MAG: hypothetical protein DCC67_09630 [Planctomycetota bacterium]